MKSNVVPISRARSALRRAPARSRPRPVPDLKLAGRNDRAHRAPLAIASVPSTPIWFSVLALAAMTMWPSALVWTVQLAYRLAAR
jgi:hypothetical protein